MFEQAAFEKVSCHELWPSVYLYFLMLAWHWARMLIEIFPLASEVRAAISIYDYENTPPPTLYFNLVQFRILVKHLAGI